MSLEELRKKAAELGLSAKALVDESTQKEETERARLQQLDTRNTQLITNLLGYLSVAAEAFNEASSPSVTPIKLTRDGTEAKLSSQQGNRFKSVEVQNDSLTIVDHSSESQAYIKTQTWQILSDQALGFESDPRPLDEVAFEIFACLPSK